MEINWSEIEQRLIDAADTGMMATGKQMQARAKALAPVRKVFQGQRNITKAPAAQKMRWRSTTSGRFATLDKAGDDDLAMIPRRGSAFSPETRIRNRYLRDVNMQERTVVEFRGGMHRQISHDVPGSEFRMKRINDKMRPSYEGFPEKYRRENEGRSTPRQFGLENPGSKVLNVRGRYEMRSGRAFYRNADGSTTMGGRLRGSIALGEVEETRHGLSLRLEAGGEEAYYAIYQELGTRHHPAHPFLRPALDEASKYYKSYLRRSIEAMRL